MWLFNAVAWAVVLVAFGRTSAAVVQQTADQQKALEAFTQSEASNQRRRDHDLRELLADFRRELAGQLDNLGRRLDGFDQRISALELWADRIEEARGPLRGQVQGVEALAAQLKSQVDALSKRLEHAVATAGRDAATARQDVNFLLEKVLVTLDARYAARIQAEMGQPDDQTDG